MTIIIFIQVREINFTVGGSSQVKHIKKFGNDVFQKEQLSQKSEGHLYDLRISRPNSHVIKKLFSLNTTALSCLISS